MTKIKVTFISSVTQLHPSIVLPEPVEVQENSRENMHA